jgi:hypothetical protein
MRLLESLPLLGLCLALGSACENEAPAPVYTLRVTALDGDERPLPGVAISFNKQPAGSTGPDGSFTQQRKGAEGTRLAGHAECPEGYVAPAPDFVITLSQIRGLGSNQNAPLLQTVSCKPMRREGVVLIKTAQPGISIVVDGAPTTQTDALGYAYVYVQRAPGGQVDVLLDTATQPKLQPQSPSRRFQFKDADEIFEFDQPFAVEKPKPKPKKRKVEPPKKHVPQRL